MKKIVFSLFLLFVVVGCATEDAQVSVDLPEGNLEDINGEVAAESVTVEDRSIHVSEGANADDSTDEDVGEESKTSEYGLEDLKEFLINFTDVGYHFNQDKSDSEYYNSNDMKFYVIHVVEDEIHDAKTFYERYSAKNWNGYLHFLNRTAMRRLREPLSEERFDDPADYKEYVQQRTLVDQTFIENTIDLEEGRVLEYQGINWKFSMNDYFDGAYEETLLIYKIYCSPKLVVFIRPSWTEFNIYLPASKKMDAYDNWNESVNKVRSEMLRRAKWILRECPVDKDFFDSLPDEGFRSTDILANYWKTEYRFYWNLTMNLTPQVELIEEGKNAGKYLLTRINFTATNYEPSILWGSLLLDVHTLSDDEDDYEYEFRTNRHLGLKIKSGETIKRHMTADNPGEKKPQFSNNLTINYVMKKYGYGFDLRSKSITIDTNGTIIKER